MEFKTEKNEIQNWKCTGICQGPPLLQSHMAINNFNINIDWCWWRFNNCWFQIGRIKERFLFEQRVLRWHFLCEFIVHELEMFWYWEQRQKYWCSPWIFWGHYEWSDVVKAALRRLAPKQDLDSQATWSMAQSVLSWRLGNNAIMETLTIVVSESCRHSRSTVAPPWKVRLCDSSPPTLFKPFSFTTTFKKVLDSFKKILDFFKKILDSFQTNAFFTVAVAVALNPALFSACHHMFMIKN